MFIFKPTTTLGTWSVRLTAAFILVLILFSAILASGERGGEGFFSNLSLAIPMLIAAILAVSSFFTGIICIIRNKERAVFVFVSTSIGILVMLWGLAEIIFPH